MTTKNNGGTFLYFSYGSNMLTERIQARCPSAKFIGTAEAISYKVIFNKESRKDGSGKANLVKSDNISDIVHGVLFEINKNEERFLDRVEGFVKFKNDNLDGDTDYIKPENDGEYGKSINFKVINNKEEIPVTTYYALIEEMRGNLFVHDWYLALIIAGGLQHKLPDKYIKNILEEITPKPDPEIKRVERLNALCVLEQSGFKSVYTEIKINS